MAQPTTLASLPDELIIRILHFLNSPRDICSVNSSSRTLNACSNDTLIWRRLCSRWKFCNSRASISDWKAEFKRRYKTDREVDNHVNKLINVPPPGRIPEFDNIWSKGYDAKDRLLWHMSSAQNDVADGLARRWWANAALTGLNRIQAVRTWSELALGADVSLEMALGAFDLFIRDGETGDLQDVERWLDELTDGFKKQDPGFATRSTRNLALTLAQYLDQNSFFDSPEDDEYYNIRNNFIGMVLEKPGNKGMPLIYVSIYCMIAQRLGLNARPCGFPTHVYAIIYPPEGKDLDGKTLAFAGKQDPMYVDSYKQFDHEVPVATLHQRLVELGTDPDERDSFLLPASTTEMVLRTCRNIMNCVQYEHAVHPDNWGAPPEFIDHDAATYLVLWVTMIFGALDPAHAFARRRSHVSLLCNQIEHNYPWDVGIYEEYILPLFHGHAELVPLQRLATACRSEDSTPPVPVRRSPRVIDEVKHKVGTLFNHRRYGYEAVVIGWDSTCEAPTTWLQQNRVDGLDNGAQQSFYHVL